MKKTIKKYKNGDFRVVYEKSDTSYGYPVRYHFVDKCNRV